MSTVSKFKDLVASNMTDLLGPSWKTTLLGITQLVVVSLYEAYEAMSDQSLTLKNVIHVLVSAIIALVCRYVKEEHHIDISSAVQKQVQGKIDASIDSLIVKPVVVTPAAEAVIQPVAKSGNGFVSNGSESPIRGSFKITAAQLEAISIGEFAPYAKYAAAIVDDSVKYGINPLFVLADLTNQGVNPEYNNPWGISADNYPYGPNGKQLGQPNGHVTNGPRRFSDNEWRTAFDRQFAVVASGKAYATANTIAEWALIDAPPNAENDVNGTNASEGAAVGALYNKLVKAL